MDGKPYAICVPRYCLAVDGCLWARRTATVWQPFSQPREEHYGGDSIPRGLPTMSPGQNSE